MLKYDKEEKINCNIVFVNCHTVCCKSNVHGINKSPRYNIYSDTHICIALIAGPGLVAVLK